MHKARRAFLKRYNIPMDNVNLNALKSEAIRKGRRFLPTFLEKVEKKYKQ